MTMHRAAGAFLCLVLMGLGIAPARAAEPITIGMSVSMTGPLAVNGKPGLVAMQIWAEDINAKGGLLGRPVKLDFYDDHYIRTNTFKTVVGDVAFGASGEWQHERMLQVQYQHLKGNDLSELKDSRYSLLVRAK